MAPVSRVTLASDGRRVDVVLPSEEPIGCLMPDILRLLGDARHGDDSPPRQQRLTTLDGRALSFEQSLAGAEVLDGTVLRLAGTADAPPAPLVHDVVEEVTEDIEGSAQRWGIGARRWTATAATAGLLANAGLAARLTVETRAAVVLLVGLAVAAVIAGVLVGSLGNEPVATALVLAGGAVGLVAVWAAADLFGWRDAVLASGIVAVVATVLGLSSYTAGLGTGGGVGAGMVIGLGGGWVAGLLVGVSLQPLAAVLAVVAVLALGLLPRVALTVSGLAGLDDRRSRGTSVSRHDVEVAIAATHRGLLTSTIVVASSAAVSGVVLADDLGPFTTPLAGVLAVALACRSRLFPLTWQVVSLLGAALATAAAVVLSFASAMEGSVLPVVAAVATAGLPLLAMTSEPPEHIRVRLRRIVDRLEAAAVIGLIPLAIGVFGVYGRLTDVFA
jgi:type VII secretion integral membrane protein EccD